MTDTSTNAFSELYSAYAAGSLDPGYALLVETQAALRSDVRGAVARSEAVAGALLEMTDAAPLKAGAADRALAMIDALDIGQPTPAGAEEDEEGEADILPPPLRRAAGPALAAQGWKRVAPGIRRVALDVGGDLTAELICIAPGAIVPRHTHAGSEHTLVVSGGFSDATGSFGPGDLALRGPEDTHQPVGDADGPCYALIVRDGGLRLTGFMGVIQRMLGK